ncbi:MAG: SulP family inorganic anion transporter [Clostridia bacterium]|nr:SulP family inorganic anion transporter [Clostridia bacterium]
MKPELFNSLKNYKRKNILNDLLAGLMVAIIALPLSIALGIQSVPAGMGNGIQAGIITAIVAGFFISLLGGSRFQIGGPTAAFVVILFGYLSNPDIGILGLAIAGIMAGVLLILMGLLRVGNVMKFFPYPITIGFTTGIGITLLIGQIKDLCGFESSGTEAIEKIASYIENIQTFDPATFLVGALGLLCVIVIPKINKKIPSAFVALILCTVVTQLLNNFAGTSIKTIGSSYGEIEAGFNLIDFSMISNVKIPSLIVPAIVIAFLCAIESLLSATVASGMTGTSFDANQELIGQGVANICSSLVGGLPATGAIARTAAGIENGSKSPLTGVFHAIFLLIMYFALMSVVGFIPLAVFSAILISVAINMSRFKLFCKLSAFGIRDSIILIVTCALTIIFDLTYGVIGGIVITLLANIGSFRRGLSLEVDGTSIKAKGSINFVNVNKILKACASMSEEKEITIDFTSVERIDETALEKLASLNRSMNKEERTLLLINFSQRVQNRYDRFFKVV